MMARIDRRRALRLVVLAGWAAFFDYLWITDEAARYIGSRTAWVVPFGGIVLTFAALLHLLWLRRGPDATDPTRRDLVGSLTLLAPIFVVAVIPAPTLGAQAVAKKQGVRAPTIVADAQGGAITVVDVAAAGESPEYARVRGVTAGMRVSLLAFVSEVASPTRFTVARFSASCCAADALPFTADVTTAQPAGSLELDQWVQVSGTLVKEGEAFVVKADAVEPVAEPSDAFL